jgi:hypothetical protein
MNPTDGTNADSPTASSERRQDDTDTYRDTQAATWDPYEVWFTRIRQPRERAARIATVTSSSRATSAPEAAPAR